LLALAEVDLAKKHRSAKQYQRQQRSQEDGL
jgi:hypothetical protein